MASPPASLGAFEQLVLLALVRLADEGYGVSIHAEIARRTGRDVSLAAVYKTLDRLEQKGLAASWLGDATRERGGRRKKHFRLQPAGRRALRQSLASIRSMTEGLPDAPLLDPEP
jgi:PadR family transcriptional regulator PadR